jgi:hypothetical protein
VETSEGKTIDRKNVTTVLLEPALKFQQRPRRPQFVSRLIAEPQTDGIRLPRTDPLPHGQGVGLERLESFTPIFAAMDICAIGQVQAVIKLHN